MRTVYMIAALTVLLLGAAAFVVGLVDHDVQLMEVATFGTFLVEFCLPVVFGQVE